MGCVFGRSVVRPIDVPENTNYDTSIRRVSVMLVSDSTLKVLHEITELPKGTYDVIVPQSQVLFGGIPVEKIVSQLEVPRCT